VGPHRGDHPVIKRVRRARHAAVVTAVFAAVTLSATRASAVRASTSRASVVPVVQPQGQVLTDTLWSQSLGTTKTLTVYLPPSYGKGSTRYPLLVYLHGRGGSERDWVTSGQLPRTMDSLVAAGLPEAIIAMPDGDDGWYTTWASLPDPGGCAADTVRKEPAATYCVPWPHYDDYIARDIVAHMDRHYRTRGTADSRGIAGLSMGGYGAITLALVYPDVFAAGASHSGVLSPRLRLGASPADRARHGTTMQELAAGAQHLWPSLRAVFGNDTIAWRARDPQILAERLDARVRRGEARMPALRFDIGVDDTWAAQNRDLDAALTRLGVAHTFVQHPGAHTWSYWRTHLPESLVFLLQTVR
jgi:S-formylglutathione hydrolase FrmB